MQSLNKENFEEEIRQAAQELTKYTQYYDQQEEESGASLAAGYDPLNNLIRGLAAKFRAEKNLGTEESLQEADKLVRQAEQEVKKTDAKKRICAVLDGFTGDVLQVLPVGLPVVVSELAKAGVIAIPADPTGVLLGGCVCVVAVRLFLRGFCAS